MHTATSAIDGTMHPQVLPALEADPVWLCVCTRSIGRYLPRDLLRTSSSFASTMSYVCPTALLPAPPPPAAPPPPVGVCSVLSSSESNGGECIQWSQGGTFTWPSIAIGSVFHFGLRLTVNPCASPDASVQVSLRDNASWTTPYQPLRSYDWGTGRKRTPTMITGMTPDGIATIEVELSLTGELSATRLELKIGAFVNSSHYDSKIAG